MSAPTDKTLRAAVIAWTKAELRRIEFLMSGRDQHDEWLERLGDSVVASDHLRVIVTRLIASEKPKRKPAKRGKR